MLRRTDDGSQVLARRVTLNSGKEPMLKTLIYRHGRIVRFPGKETEPYGAPVREASRSESISARLKARGIDVTASPPC